MGWATERAQRDGLLHGEDESILRPTVQQRSIENAASKPGPTERHGGSGVPTTLCPTKHFVRGQETAEVVAVSRHANR